jgi:hypothetical protein
VCEGGSAHISVRPCLSKPTQINATVWHGEREAETELVPLLSRTHAHINTLSLTHNKHTHTHTRTHTLSLSPPPYHSLTNIHKHSLPPHSLSHTSTLSPRCICCQVVTALAALLKLLAAEPDMAAALGPPVADAVLVGCRTAKELETYTMLLHATPHLQCRRIIVFFPSVQLLPACRMVARPQPHHLLIATHLCTDCVTSKWSK